MGWLDSDLCATSVGVSGEVKGRCVTWCDDGPAPGDC